MIAVLDACTIFNLINFSEDGNFLKLTNSIFEKVNIVPKVREEILNNYKQALTVDNKNEEEITNLLSKEINDIVDYSVIEKKISDSVLKCVNNRKDGKRDGEFESVCFAIMQSRDIINDKFGENLHKVHFITDDTPAKDEFASCYQLNQTGKILDTIDLLITLYLKDKIQLNELRKCCNNLIFFYNKSLNDLRIEIKSIQEKSTLTNKESSLLSEIITLLDNYTEESEKKLISIFENTSFKSLVQKFSSLKNLSYQLLKANCRDKIAYIQNRKKMIDNIYI